MIINDEITIKDYKCFDSTGAGFKKISPINIIVGKNNSGKSSLIDLIKFLTCSMPNIPLKDMPKESKIYVKHKLHKHEVEHSIGKTGYIMNKGQNINVLDLAIDIPNQSYTYSIDNKGHKNFIEMENYKKIKNFELLSSTIEPNQIMNIAAKLKHPLYNKTFRHITAERNITPENYNSTNSSLDHKGEGATNIITLFITNRYFEHPIIEQKLLKELNKIINPDIYFSRILVANDGKQLWEIFFENDYGQTIPLSKMGSGIKTVLLVLLNLIVIPELFNKSPSDFVFAFEELENNLHPALQRRLYQYIKKYSENNSTYFFITTHSNIIIDIFGTYEKAQIIHITNDGIKSNTNTIFSENDTKKILKDLDIRASDLLQSNGIIWVEGPSDRIYLNKWLQILAPNLEEGIHYSIMFYGGRLLANLTFDYDFFNRDIIPLMKINMNAFVIMDRDGEEFDAKINATKERMKTEIGENNYWITQGREIENYLTKEVINNWLKEKYDSTINIKNDPNTKLENNILNAIISEDKKIKYNSNKTIYSREISKFIDKKSLNSLDLKNNLENLISNIRKWNNMRE